MPVIIIVADGARADTFETATRSGQFPALRRLRDEGALHEITTVFPSVTGPAYAPFLTGRHPGPIGLPGLRWFDRSRTRCTRPPYCRSYLGGEMRHMDRDLDPATSTLFDLAPSRFNAMSMIGRGTRRREQMGRDVPTMLRIAAAHLRGDVGGWLRLDRAVGRAAAQCFRAEQPALTFLALLGLDKTSHAAGHLSDGARQALRVLDDVVAELRAVAEHARVWETTHLWVVSDHGHSSVDHHDDLATIVRHAGYRVIAHPHVFTRRPDVAVMVSGNAMAHLYVELARRDRPWWPELAARWTPLVDELRSRPSVDLVLLPHSPTRCEIRARDRGSALVERVGERYSYRPLDGDPLGIGERNAISADETHDLTIDGDYPDAIVQIIQLAGADRSGEIILSAAHGWDFRAGFEPIPHVSTHGALLREHMLVPLLVNRPVSATPRRTVDIMPSAARALGLAVPDSVEGRSFL